MERHHDNAGLVVGLTGTQEGLPSCTRGVQVMTVDRSHELARAKERIAELRAVNTQLELQVAELSRHNREVTLVSRMNDLLQASTTEGEAYSIISETLTQLFPRDAGALFVPSASRDMLETAVVWGTLPPPNLTFSPNGCWAHRRNQADVAVANGPTCPHCRGDERAHACFPLRALGNTVGILHLLACPDGPAGTTGMARQPSVAWRRLSPSASVWASPT
jgi:hypothetical protein